MNDEWKRVPKDHFKGKKFELAPTTGVDLFWEIAEDFMQKSFDLPPGDYLITDESSLFDFTGFGVEIEDLHNQILQTYDLDVSDVESGNLFEIFQRIHHKKYGTPG